jgi:hypothetical protein
MKTETLLIVLAVAGVGAYLLMRKPAAPAPAPSVTNVTNVPGSNKWDAIIAGTREAGSLGRNAITTFGA